MGVNFDVTFAYSVDAQNIAAIFADRVGLTSDTVTVRSYAEAAGQPDKVIQGTHLLVVQ